MYLYDSLYGNWNIMKVQVTQIKTRLIPLVKWEKFHVWPSTGSLRRMVQNGKKTGFDKVIKRYGSRILIDEAKFFEWMEEINRKD